jgi:hypothetical protein
MPQRADQLHRLGSPVIAHGTIVALAVGNRGETGIADWRNPSCRESALALHRDGRRRRCESLQLFGPGLPSAPATSKLVTAGDAHTSRSRYAHWARVGHSVAANPRFEGIQARLYSEDKFQHPLASGRCGR